jgi:hypothetical protein
LLSFRETLEGIGQLHLMLETALGVNDLPQEFGQLGRLVATLLKRA